MLLSATKQVLSLIFFPEVFQQRESIVLDPSTPAIHATIHLVGTREDTHIVLMICCDWGYATLMVARM